MNRQRLVTLGASLLLTGGISRPVLAQATPAAPAQGEAQAQPTAAEAAEAPPNVADLASKVAEADQTARIAVRRVEILEEQLATKAKETAAKPPATVSADEKGFGIKSGDGAFALKLRGLLQADSRWFLNDGALSDKVDTFLVRRFRPTIEGTVFGLVDFKFMPDFAGSAAVVFDGYIDAHPFPWLRLRVGKFKTPLGLERLQSDSDLVFIERALTQWLTPTRDVGASIWGDIGGGIVNYSVGVYNGAADAANPDLDANHAKDFVGRILLQPFKAEELSELGSLGLHFAASTGNRFGLPTATQLPSFRSGGQNSFFSYLAPAATADPTGSGTPFAHLRQTRINPGLFYYVGPLGLLGEYVWSKQAVQKGNVTGTVAHQAAHATLSFVIGGKAGFDGVTPKNPLDLKKGTLGALEIGARWNYLKIDDATFGDPNDPAALVLADNKRSAKKAQGLGVAFTYVPSRAAKLSVTFEQTRFTAGSSVSTTTTDPDTMKAITTSTVTDRKTENALFARAQVNF